MVFTETNQYSKNLAHNIVRKKLQNKERSNEVNLTIWWDKWQQINDKNEKAKEIPTKQHQKIRDIPTQKLILKVSCEK